MSLLYYVSYVFCFCICFILFLCGLVFLTIPTLCITIELLLDTAPIEQRLLNLESLDEDRRSSLQNNEAAKK
jgi:hypothetical protein